MAVESKITTDEPDWDNHGESWSEHNCQVMRKCILAIGNVLMESETLLNKYDSAGGDGDCGSTMTLGGKGDFIVLGIYLILQSLVSALIKLTSCDHQKRFNESVTSGRQRQVVQLERSVYYRYLPVLTESSTTIDLRHCFARRINRIGGIAV